MAVTPATLELAPPGLGLVADGGGGLAHALARGSGPIAGEEIGAAARPAPTVSTVASTPEPSSSSSASSSKSSSSSSASSYFLRPRRRSSSARSRTACRNGRLRSSRWLESLRRCPRRRPRAACAARSGSWRRAAARPAAPRPRPARWRGASCRGAHPAAAAGGEPGVDHIGSPAHSAINPPTPPRRAGECLRELASGRSPEPGCPAH